MKPMASRRSPVRAVSFRGPVSVPLMTILPASAFSSSPAMCRRVDLPEPEGPTSATISPGATASDTPCRISRS